jgi:serine/threonine protein kinase
MYDIRPQRLQPEPGPGPTGGWSRPELSIETVKRIIHETAQALEHLHQELIIHR